jgi:hypothetical protein
MKLDNLLEAGALSFVFILQINLSKPANAQAPDSFFSPYLERIEGVTMGAGEAKEANAVSQMVDPWPAQVRNKRIPANGARMSGAVERYQDPRKLKDAPVPLGNEPIKPAGFSSSTGAR